MKFYLEPQYFEICVSMKIALMMDGQTRTIPRVHEENCKLLRRESLGQQRARHAVVVADLSTRWRSWFNSSFN